MSELRFMLVVGLDYASKFLRLKDYEALKLYLRDRGQLDEALAETLSSELKLDLEVALSNFSPFDKFKTDVKISDFTAADVILLDAFIICDTDIMLDRSFQDFIENELSAKCIQASAFR